jgi:hypothetical protein
MHECGQQRARWPDFLTEERLFAAIDAVLQPTGVVSDLHGSSCSLRDRFDGQPTSASRSPPTHTAHAPRRRSSPRAARCGPSVTCRLHSFQSRAAATATATVSALRVWTVRIDVTAFSLYPGICKPSSTGECDPNDSHSVRVGVPLCMSGIGPWMMVSCDCRYRAALRSTTTRSALPALCIISQPTYRPALEAGHRGPRSGLTPTRSNANGMDARKRYC